MGNGTGRLAGRRILITGAAGGIGQATARLFAAEGAAVALLDREAEAVERLAAELGGFGASCDVADPDDVARAVTAAATALGGLDGLINAAGMLLMGAVADSPVENWTRVINVNLTGTMLVSRAAIPFLREAGKGTIVNIASLAALRPPPASTAYAVSKAGVIMLTRCLAVELGPQIRVNSVCPGTIETAMTASLRQDNAISERLAASAAAKRFGAPEEVASTMLFLTTDESSFVNGAAISVDGGVAFH